MWSNPEKSMELRKYVAKNQLSVTVRTNASGMSSARMRAELDKSGLSQSLRRSVGERCGMNFTLDHSSPEKTIYDPVNSSTETRAFVTTMPPSTGATGARCIPNSPVCTITFDYHGFTGEMPISRQKFCEWPYMTRHIIQFLDRHLVRATNPRRKH
jgi:hypothetical protein